MPKSEREELKHPCNGCKRDITWANQHLHVHGNAEMPSPLCRFCKPGEMKYYEKRLKP